MGKGSKPKVVGTPKPKVAPKVEAPPTAREVTIRAPLSTGELERIHIKRHLDFRLNSRVQRETAKRLYQGLNACGARLPNATEPGQPGRYVQTVADAMRWLLEELGKKTG